MSYMPPSDPPPPRFIMPPPPPPPPPSRAERLAQAMIDQRAAQAPGSMRPPHGLPTAVAFRFAQLPQPAQEAFASEYAKRSKSTGVAFVAWLLLGWHYLYVGKVGVQIAFWLTGGGVLGWWIVDLFRLGRIVRDANASIAHQIMGSLV